MPDPLSDVLRVKWDDARAPQRVLVTAINQSTNQAQITMLENSHPIPGATITLDIHHMHAHIIGCIRAYEMMRSPPGENKKLLMPFMMGGKAVIP